MNELTVAPLPVGSLKPYDRNARTHSDRQIAQIAASITAFGFNNPVLIDKDGGIIAGHGRVAAARKLRLVTVPCVRLDHLDDAQKRAYILADNRLAEKAGWDPEILKIELQHLTSLDLDFDVTVTGFEIGEIDVLLGGEPEASAASSRSRPSTSSSSRRPRRRRSAAWWSGPGCSTLSPATTCSRTSPRPAPRSARRTTAARRPPRRAASDAECNHGGQANARGGSRGRRRGAGGRPGTAAHRL